MTELPPEGKRADMIVHQQEPYNAETPPDALVQAALTPADAFYVRGHGPIPRLDPAAWRLSIEGLVHERLELSLAELQTRFAPRKIVATLQCAGNRRAELIAVRDIPGEAPWGPGATGTAEWHGVSLADVLVAAGIEDQARYVEFAGADVSAEASPAQRFGGSITRRKALAGEVLLAWSMNGQPLAQVHGAPVRVVVPGYIGARSVKWLERVIARDTPTENFFQATAYRLLPADTDPESASPGSGFALGAVALNADILTPRDGSTVRAGSVEARGYAVVGDDRHIARVDVSSDGGASWCQAELLDPPSRWAWTRWRTQLRLDPGPAQIIVRAWDSAAATQPEDPAQLWNPKGYVNNAWGRASLTVEA